jgi:hypothetical protein
LIRHLGNIQRAGCSHDGRYLAHAIGTAMVVAGLLSVVLFPLGALTLLRDIGKPAVVVQREDLNDAGGDEPGPT